jgi:hypothetical protein
MIEPLVVVFKRLPEAMPVIAKVEEVALAKSDEPKSVVEPRRFEEIRVEGARDGG